MRLMPSGDTWGLGGNLRLCFQFKIFCRVTCRYRIQHQHYTTSRKTVMTYRVTNKRWESAWLQFNEHYHRHQDNLTDEPIEAFKHDYTKTPPVTGV